MEKITNATTVLGRLVSALRAELGLNQIEFAERCGLHESAIARIETGRNTISMDHVLLLESVFKGAGLLLSFGDLTRLMSQVRHLLIQDGVEVRLGKLSRLSERIGGRKPRKFYSHRLIDLAVASVLFDWRRERAGKTPDVHPVFVWPSALKGDKLGRKTADDLSEDEEEP